MPPSPLIWLGPAAVLGAGDLDVVVQAVIYQRSPQHGGEHAPDWRRVKGIDLRGSRPNRYLDLTNQRFVMSPMLPPP